MIKPAQRAIDIALGLADKPEVRTRDHVVNVLRGLGDDLNATAAALHWIADAVAAQGESAARPDAEAADGYIRSLGDVETWGNA